jgi:hypothetical protein
MGRFRTMMNQSPAIVISVIALVFSLGGGAGYAATVVAKAAAPKTTWHKLSLRNGWAAAAKGYDAGSPSYTVINGVVYLTGAVSRSSTSLPSVIGVLPKSARPKHVLAFPAFNYAAGGESSIYVDPNGDVEVLGTGGDEYYFTSFNGIVFPLGA